MPQKHNKTLEERPSQERASEREKPLPPSCGRRADGGNRCASAAREGEEVRGLRRPPPEARPS